MNPTTGDVGVITEEGDLFLKYRATNRHNHGSTVRLGVEPFPVTKEKAKDVAPYGKPGTPESMEKARKSIEDYRRGIR